jgi:hypothetical protein
MRADACLQVEAGLNPPQGNQRMSPTRADFGRFVHQYDFSQWIA